MILSIEDERVTFVKDKGGYVTGILGPLPEELVNGTFVVTEVDRERKTITLTPG